MFVSTLNKEFKHLSCFGEEALKKTTQNCFCFASDSPIKFRTPITSDALDNPIRKQLFDELGQRRIKLSFIASYITTETARYFEFKSKTPYLDHWHAMQDMLPAELWIMDE